MLREGPQRQLRREYIKAVEVGLLRHPLAIYPHLIEAIPGGVSHTTFLKSINLLSKLDWV